ncbi:MAG: hypothetical protein FJ284_14265, partial [Planctomycetes bacterium]|nr:hypothetical protein [Planctomycetota bacterium]
MIRPARPSLAKSPLAELGCVNEGCAIVVFRVSRGLLTLEKPEHGRPPQRGGERRAGFHHGHFKPQRVSSMIDKWFVAALLLVVSCCGLRPSSAEIVGPYTPNATTVHLLHLDEPQGTTSLPDAVSGAGTWTANQNGQNGLGQAGYTGSPGFETSLRIGNPGDVRGFIRTQSGSQILGSTKGSWTIETLINFDNLTDGEIIRGGVGFDHALRLRWHQNGGQAFQVEIPNRVAGGAKVANLGFTPQINTWYHVGLVYDSTLTSSDNTFLYMTEMNPATTAAVLRASLNNQPGGNFIGYDQTLSYINIGQYSAGNANVRLDELRISNVALGAEQMMFRPAVPPAQVWHGDGVNQGGSGTWTDSSNTWGSGGVVGPMQPGLMGVFPLPDGIVTIGQSGATASGGLTFKAGSQYQLTGGPLTLAGAAAAANSLIVESAATATISARVVVTAGLTKSGVGELVLGGAGSVLGGATVSEGTLSIAATHTYSGTLAVDPTQALLAFSPTGSITCAAVITGGPVSHTGPGTTLLTATNTYTGVTTLAA